MSVQFKTFNDFVGDMSTRWTAEVGVNPALVSGDPLLAIFQAVGTQMIFLENCLQQVILMARASTSTNGDLDTWMADFGLTRLPATEPDGQEVFNSLTPATSLIPIPVGTIVQTLGGAIQYQVVEDDTLPGWNKTLGAYAIPVGQTSVTVKVQSLNAGSVNNVQANQLVQMGSAIAGVSSVTNPEPITNGLDPETDAAFRQRFINFLASLSKATRDAILYCINAVQQGLHINLLDNMDPNGNTYPGFFTAIVDDGSGSPPTELMDKISAAINVTRAFTVNYVLIPPNVINAAIVIQVRTSLSPPDPDLQAVATAILNYVDSLEVGESLLISELSCVALNASPTITNVNTGGILINGQHADLAITGSQEVKALSTGITVNLY